MLGDGMGILYEVMMAIGGGRYRVEKFPAEEYESEEDQLEAMLDLVRGCRFSDTEYYVFADNNLTDY